MHVERAPASSRLTRSAFEIPRMDCAAEERLVRIALRNGARAEGSM